MERAIFDLEAVLAERERAYEDDPRDWGDQMPFQGEPVPIAPQAGLTPVADVVGRAVTGNLRGHSPDAGVAAADGCPGGGV